MSGNTQVLWRRAPAHVLDGLPPFVLALRARHDELPRPLGGLAA